MGHTLELAAIGAVALLVLDGVWLGLLMKNFYREQLAPIVRAYQQERPRIVRRVA